MPVKIRMPALSPTMTEGGLARWLVKEGDRVSAGDVIAEIETDKATMEVEAVEDGVVARILVPEGAEGVAVNEVIATLAGAGEDPASPPEESAAAGAAGDSAAAPAATAEPEATPPARRVAAQAGVDPSSVADAGARGKVVAAAPAAGRVFVSPLARRMAAQAGLDLAAVRGSGPEGRILKADVEAALGAPGPDPAPVAPAADEPGGFELVKLGAKRKVIARRMAESKATVPHFYLSADCEIDELLRIREGLNKRAEPDRISVNDIVIRACALALRKVPEANVAFESADAMRRYDVVDIAVAVAVEGGLITPVLRRADRKGILEISREMKALADRARAGRLTPGEYRGGSFSISNLGMYGVERFTAVIDPPQACILAVGVGEKRPVVKDGEIVPATVMTCTLSVDHRVADGVIGARLLAEIKRYLEYPSAMLL